VAVTLDLDDIQGLVARGYGRLRAARFTLFAAGDATAARALLSWVLPRVTTAGPFSADAAWHIAYTAAGLRRLGLPPGTVGRFSAEFVAGLADPNRTRFLGDVEKSDPQDWAWGGPQSPPIDGVLLLYTVDTSTLERLQAELNGRLDALGISRHELHTTEYVGTEPFNFRDGISQPIIDGLPKATAGARTVPAGEFVLGYPNAYRLITDRPLLPPSADPHRLLPRDPAGTGAADLGRNGSYLVVRQLAQDVEAFQRYTRDATRNSDGSADPAAQLALQARMVGRWHSGAPLVKSPDRDDPRLGEDNDFGYHHTDPLGLACPVGAHVRRANPRDSLDPAPGTDRSLEGNGRHRLLRRGRSYRTGTGETGLHFMCLAGNLARQFEFVQHTWLNDPTFHGLYDDTDPLVGGHHPSGATFTVAARPVRRRYRDLPQFVRTRGGSYFFLPGIAALRYLAQLRADGAATPDPDDDPTR